MKPKLLTEERGGEVAHAVGRTAFAISDGRLLMADRGDAALVVQLAQWGTMMGLDEAILEEAILEVFGDDFDPRTTSLGRRAT